RRAGARRAQGPRLRAGREGAGGALRLPDGGVRVAAGVRARAGPPAPGRVESGAPARLARRGDAAAAAPGVHPAAAPPARGRRARHGPTVRWCGIEVTRPWRCGCRGNVASVLIEKPARGDFLPILDGGYALQYSPLLEYREGRGMVLFCQLDVTGRTEGDPAADRLARNILGYVSAWKPKPRRQVVYAGDPAG